MKKWSVLTIAVMWMLFSTTQLFASSCVYYCNQMPDGTLWCTLTSGGAECPRIVRIVQ